jgi:hypothetical protein
MSVPLILMEISNVIMGTIKPLVHLYIQLFQVPELWIKIPVIA